MKVVIQRVSECSVTIDKKIHSQIDNGLMILLGITDDDTTEDIDWLCHKIVNMRIFNDDQGVMNLSLLDKCYDVLVVSQFTLHALTKKGHRPSYIKAAKPQVAIPMYETFNQTLSDLIGKPVQSGVFGADMKVQLINDGPVTIILDSKCKN